MAIVGVVGGTPVSLTTVLTQGGAKEVRPVTEAAEVENVTHLVVTTTPLDEEMKAVLQSRVRDGAATLFIGSSVEGLNAYTRGTGIAVADTPDFLHESWVSYEVDSRCKFLKTGSAYFPTTERCLKSIPLGWVGGWTGPFSADSVVAGVEFKHVLALQFLPQASSVQGRSTVMRWLKYKAPEKPVSPPPAKQRTAVTALVRVSKAGAEIGSPHPVPVQNLAQSDLPAAWEAGGCDAVVVMGSEPDLILQTVTACMTKTALPIVAEASTEPEAVSLLSAGVSQVIYKGKPPLESIPKAKLLSLAAVGPDGVVGDIESNTAGVVVNVPDEMFSKEEDNAVSAVASVVAAASKLGGSVWLLGGGVPLKSMLRVAETAAPTHLIRYPLTNGAAPAKIKGALLTADINTRIQPTGMQYNSTNLQCVIPALEIQQGSVSTGKGTASITDLAAAVDTFSLVGDVCVVDVDSSMGISDGKAAREILKPLFRKYNVRYGGGVRTVDDAMMILNEGAAKVVIGSAGDREFLSQLPKDRVVLSIDAVFSTDALVGTWTTLDNQPITKVITDLCDIVGHFQVTFLEPHLPGLDLALVMKLAATCKASKVALTIAGPVRTPQEIAAVDEMGVECLVSTSVLGTPHLPLSSAVTSIIKTDRQDGLYATVVIDSSNGRALGLCYSNNESIREAVKRKRGTYWSRSRGLWIKGETSGDVQELVGIAVDCDRDCLLFTVRQSGSGFCHRHQQTCFGPASGFDKLMATLQQRKANAPAGSYTKRLFDDQALLRAKLMEEATELAESPNIENCAFEAADLIYFAFVRCVAMGVDMSEIQKNLDFKGRKVHRRPGNAKPQFVQQQPQN